MKARRILTLVVFPSILVFASCSKQIRSDPSGTATVRASAPAVKMFERRPLVVGAFHNLNEFIRPEVRERLDQEPVGTNDDYSVAPPTVDIPTVEDSTSAEPNAEQESEPNEIAQYSEENPLQQQELDKVKFSWAKKKFGDALATDPNMNGVIVLYADDNFYDLGRLSYYVEEGKGRLASFSEIDPSRIQVVYGGYRGVAQVEMWLVPVGENIPEFKPDERNPETPDKN